MKVTIEVSSRLGKCFQLWNSSVVCVQRHRGGVHGVGISPGVAVCRGRQPRDGRRYQAWQLGSSWAIAAFVFGAMGSHRGDTKLGERLAQKVPEGSTVRV